MAYGDKFKLDFSDNAGNPRRVIIQKKDYSGEIKDLVGTANPVILKWDSDDDIYSPIRGSSCELNLFVTDSTEYDNWYEADEREYKVIIGTGSSLGSPIWDVIEDLFNQSPILWDDPGSSGIVSYWEGFLVVDRYSEAFSNKPYPIKLIASDGLGTLDGYDAPESSILTDAYGNPDPSQTQSNFDTLFYYLVEILKFTGLDFNIAISHNIRDIDGTDSDQETIFHDISVKEWALLGKNFKRQTAKKLLAQILKALNARIFQSNSQWYVISNSNLVDSRIYQSVSENSPIDPDDDQRTETSTPTCELLDFEVFKNTEAEIVLTGFDVDFLSEELGYSITELPLNGTLEEGATNINNQTIPYEMELNTLIYTPNNNYVGSDYFYYKVSNGTNTSSACLARITVKEPIASGVGGVVTLDFNVTSDSTDNLFWGETLEQAVERAVSFRDNIMGTKYQEIWNSFGYNGTPSHFFMNFDAQFQFTYSAQQLDDSANNTGDHTWQRIGIGDIPAIYLEYVNPNSATAPNNYVVYNSANNTVDDAWEFFSDVKYPRLEQVNNGVINLPDGYYATRKTTPYVSGSFTFFGRREMQERGYRIPFYTSFDKRSSTDPLLSIRGLTTTTGADYPEDLKSLQEQNSRLARPTDATVYTPILYAFRIQDGVVVARYELPLV